MTIDSNGGYVASQMWETVSNLITFSSDLMRQLLTTVGADEVSPFCRTFNSPRDLRNAFISYLPRTFIYNEVSGTGSEESSDEDADENSTSVQDSLADRINRFASEMAKDEDGDDDDEDEVVVVDGCSGDDEPTSNAANTNTASAGIPSVQELMTHFRAMLEVSSCDDILEKVLTASSSLECEDDVIGDVHQVRQAKSLVQRWLSRPLHSAAEDGSSPSEQAEETLIERDVIVLVKVKVGNGASASIVTRPYRVVDIYDKHYNKWFMSKPKNPVKKWKKEEKRFKLKVRMLEQDAVSSYADVALCDASTYKKESICRIIDDDMIMGVVGKLHASVV